MVSDGAAARADRAARGARCRSRAASPQLIRALNKARRNNTLYVKLLGVGCRRGRQRRAALVAAAVGAGRARRRSQRRQLQPAAAAPRSANGSCPPSTPSAASRTLTIHRLRRTNVVESPHSRLHGYCHRCAARARRRRSRCVAARTASSPKFFQAATQADFLKGDVENLSIDEHGQLMLGPATELVYETPAPFLWTMVPAPDGIAVHRHRQRRPGVPRRPAGQGRAVFRRRRTRGARARAGAQRRPVCRPRRPTAKSTGSIATAAATTFFDPRGQVHLGARRRRQGQRLRRHRRKGRRLQDHARRQGRRRSTRPRRRMRPRWPSTRAATCSSAPESPGSVLRVDAEGKAFVLLDSPFQEIRALRFDDKGMLYVAAVSGRPSGGAAPARRPTALERPTARSRAARRSPSVSTEITVDRRSSNVGGAGQRRRPRERSARSPKGADLSHRARRPVGSAVGVARRLAVRPRLRARRRADRRHRRQGQDLPARRRSAAADAARARRRAAGHRVLPDARGPAVLRHRESRASCSASRPSARRAGTYESEVRDAQMVATWGAISWRGTAPAGSRSRGVHAIGQHRDARRHVERLVARVQQRRRLGDRQPQGALSAVARGADRQRRRPGAHVGHRRLSPAQPAPGGPLGHRASAGHRVPEAVLAPANRRWPASTTSRRRSASWRRRRRRAAQRSSSLGRRTYQKGLQTCVWKAEDDNDDDLAYDVLYRREGETAWKTLRKALTDTDPRVGHDDGAERHLLHEGRRVRRAVESDRHRAHRRARKPAFDIDNTPPAISVGGRARRRQPDHRHLRREGRSLAGSARGVFAGRRALAARVPGGRHRRLAVGTLRDRDRWRAAATRPDPARHRLDEQRGHDPRPAAAQTVEEFEELRS